MQMGIGACDRPDGHGIKHMVPTTLHSLSYIFLHLTDTTTPHERN
jgi:hypothetical protein